MAELGLYSISGSTGLRRSGGRVQEEWKRALRGELGPRKYREMADNDSYVRLGLTMLTLMQQRPRVKVRTPDQTDAECVEMARVLETSLDDMDQSFQDLMEQADSQNTFGWCPMEVVYKRRRGLRPGVDAKGEPLPGSRYSDGRVGWAGWYMRAQETRDRWEMHPRTGEIIALHQVDNVNGVKARLPLRDPVTGMQKLLLFRTDTTKGNPEGRSLCRAIHVDYEHKKHHLQFEGIRAQKDVTGVLDGQAPPAAWTDPGLIAIRQDMEQKMAQFSLNELAFIMRPSEDVPNGAGKTGWGLRPMPSSGPTVIDHDRVIRRCGGNILMSFFAEIAAMGAAGESSGSMALGGVKKEVTVMACEALNRKKEHVINRDAVPSLMLMNGWDDPSKWPWVEFEPVQPADVWKVLDSAVKMLQVGGLTNDHSTEQWTRELLGAPPLPEQAPDTDPVPGADAMDGGGAPGAAPPSGAAQEAQANAGLTIQYLSLAMERARSAGDNALADTISAKIGEMLGRL